MVTEETPNVTTKRSKAYLGNTQNNALSNPCLKEQELSLNCLHENLDDKDACEVYFLNYKNCKAFWGQITKERRALGLTPYLPLPEEREKIMKERRKMARPQ